jgi:predicted nucleic acid-binding protein
MSESPLRVVCDAGPLIHRDELGCLDLLADFQSVLVPEQVWREVEHHRPTALENLGTNLHPMPINISEEASFMALVSALVLDLGEQAALSLMAQYPDAILLTDDAADRLAGRGLGYHTYTGVLAFSCEPSAASKEPRIKC